MFMNVIECLRVVREHSRTFEIINDVRRRSETFRDVQKMTIWLSNIVHYYIILFFHLQEFFFLIFDMQILAHHMDGHISA